MKIIHGHDYYDSALAYGQDDDVVLVREKNRTLSDQQARSVPKLLRWFSDLYFIGKHGSYDGNWRGIPLSGQRTAYVRCFRVYVADQNWCGWKVVIGNTSTYHYAMDTLEKWASQEGYTLKQNTSRYYVNQYTSNLPPRLEVTPPELLGWMVENQVTIITWEDIVSEPVSWRLNGDNLRDMQMYKVVDAYSMFQIISQWVGGVLPQNSNAMVQITDDKIKIHKHGFDKFSFRKPSQHHK